MRIVDLPFAAMTVVASWFTFTACQSSPTSLPEPLASEEQGDEEPGDMEGVYCGGFAGIACPEGYVCKDDPLDDCNPDKGGSDCGGICLAAGADCKRKGRQYVSTDPDTCAAILFYCAPGLARFSDEDCGCGCEPAPAGTLRQISFNQLSLN
jgi:hypothetical protein